MALPWVKVHVSVLDNDIFRRLSAEARATFLICIPLAQKCDRDGELSLRVGPMTISEVSYYTGIDPKRQQRFLDELVMTGFMGTSPDGSYRIERFGEFQGDSSTKRVRALRERQRNVPPETPCNVTETLHGRYGNALDKEEEEDVDKDTPLPPTGEPGSENAGTRVPRPISEPFGLADWFFAEAFGLGLLGKHTAANRDKFSLANAPAAKELLANGVSECEIRARRYLLAIKSGELTKANPTLRGLKSAWDWGCVARPGKGVKGPAKIYAVGSAEYIKAVESL